MAAADASLELLGHFDRPSAPMQERRVHTRGVGWVLQWAAALATLVIAAGVLMEFGYCVAAEQALSRAARAGVLEATLPRATYVTVAAAVKRRLADASISNRLQFGFHQNGVSVGRAFYPQDGDHLRVTLSVTTHAVVPAWLRALNFWRGDSLIQIHADRQMPGREVQSK